MVDKLIQNTQEEQKLEQSYRAELINRIEKSTCFEVWDLTVETDELESLLKGCVLRGAIK